MNNFYDVNLKTRKNFGRFLKLCRRVRASATESFSGFTSGLTISAILSIGSAMLVLSACSSMKQDLGLGRNPPDEFAVVDRAPLSLPPDFSLRPPKPGEPRPQEVDPSKHASESLFAGSTDNPDNPNASANNEISLAEKSLIEQTGAAKAPADIRSTINHEASQRVNASDHLLDRLLWWKANEKPATVVDAPAEAERIKAAKDKGEPGNATATPIIEKDKGGWLGL